MTNGTVGKELPVEPVSGHQHIPDVEVLHSYFPFHSPEYHRGVLEGQQLIPLIIFVLSSTCLHELFVVLVSNLQECAAVKNTMTASTVWGPRLGSQEGTSGFTHHCSASSVQKSTQWQRQITIMKNVLDSADPLRITAGKQAWAPYHQTGTKPCPEPGTRHSPGSHSACFYASGDVEARRALT